MANKRVTGRDFAAGSITLTGDITGNIHIIGRDVTDEPISSATISEGTLSPAGSTDALLTGADFASGALSVAGFTGDLYLIGRDFEAGCVVGGDNTITGKGFQTGRALATTLVAAGGGGPTVFVVTDNESEPAFASYAGNYYDSGEVTTTDGHTIYTNGTRYEVYDDNTQFTSFYFADLAAAQAETGPIYNGTSPFNDPAASGHGNIQIVPGGSTVGATAAP